MATHTNHPAVHLHEHKRWYVEHVLALQTQQNAFNLTISNQKTFYLQAAFTFDTFCRRLVM